MATDSTLQKIADNLLAQFDKTLLDNSTDFSSCDQILNAAPSEHKGGLESLYCDLLLDALISGYYRYSEMDTQRPNRHTSCLDALRKLLAFCMDVGPQS